MQNDLSTQHISLTCPHCGKHYKKVPYAAIKKFHFAFCKKCNAKFQISPEELEEALKQSLNATQPQEFSAEAAPPAAGHDSSLPQTAAETSFRAGDKPSDAIPDPAAQAGSPAEPPPEHFLSAPPLPQQDRATADLGLEQILEQKITDLAATMEETFSSPPVEIATGSPGPEESGLPTEPFDACLEPLAAEFADMPPWEEASPADALFVRTEDGLPQDCAAGEAPDDDFSLMDISINFPEEQSIALIPQDFPVIQDSLFEDRDDTPGEPEEHAPDDILEAILSQDLSSPAARIIAGPEQLPLQDIVEEVQISDGQELSLAELSQLLSDQDKDDRQQFCQDAPGTDSDKEIAPAYKDLLVDVQQAYLTDQLSMVSAARGEKDLQQFCQGAPGTDSERAEELISAEEDLLEISFQQTPFYQHDEALTEPAPEDTPEELPAEQDGPEISPVDRALSGLEFSEPFSPEPEEELFEDELLEETPEDLPADSRELLAPVGVFHETAAVSGDSVFDYVRNTDGSRDISAMLRELVQPAAEIQEGMEQFVLFSLGEQAFAAPIANVLELSLPPELIGVPNTPAWILGICNMRGEIISVVDLKSFLNIESDTIKKPSRMIIAQTGDRNMAIGLVVDRINGIKYFPVDELQPFEQPAPGISGSFAIGTCVHENSTVVFLDFEQVLQSPKMRQFQ